MKSNSNNNQIGDLRSHLFAQLDRLSDPSCNLDKEILRAEAIVDVGRVIVDSAKAETEFMKISGSIGTGFIPTLKELPDDSTKRIGSGQ